MKSYGQFCPVAKAAELFCERWTALIIRDLADGPRRFSELHKGVPLMSPTLLSQRLKQLEAEDVLVRRAAPAGRGRSAVTYALTKSGREFVPLVQALGVWGQRWALRSLKEAEIDLGLLLWTLETSVDATAFGDARRLVQLEFTDVRKPNRLWWFLNENGECELCDADPGPEPDLYLSCSLPDMIYLIRGDLPLPRAIDSGRLEVIGSGEMRRALRRWLNLGAYARIKSQRGDAGGQRI